MRQTGADPWAVLAEVLEARIEALRALPLQVVPSGRVSTDPLSGRRVLLSAGRAGRPRTTGSANGAPFGPYREGRTPPTLFYVPEGPGTPTPPLVVERETESVEALRAEEGFAGSPWDLVQLFGARSRADRQGSRVPLVFPAEPWSARTFFNLAPIAADPRSGANGFVIAVHPDYEDADLGLPSIGSWPALPLPVTEALVWSWALLQEWADRRGLISVPFINGGKSSASGQSLSAFHAQFYAVDAALSPPVHDLLRRMEIERGCPLCRLIDTRDLAIAQVGSVGVFAHPTPEIESTLLVIAGEHVNRFPGLADPADLARGLSLAVGSFSVSLGHVPPYNVVVRAGSGVGHLHAEVIPRGGVPVPGGFEKATGLFVSTRDPMELARQLRPWFAGRAALS